MANPIIIIGIALTSIITIGGYFLTSGMKTEKSENSGEIINTVKVVLPENREITNILYCLAAVIMVFLIIKSLRHCINTCKNNPKSTNKNKLSEMELANLDNPTYE